MRPGVANPRILPGTHEGEATPAGWEPGKLTLKPGEDLVGKVCEIWAPGMAF